MKAPQAIRPRSAESPCEAARELAAEKEDVYFEFLIKGLAGAVVNYVPWLSMLNEFRCVYCSLPLMLA